MDNEYNAAIIEEFRASNGRVGGSWAGYVVILIHQVGARSAVERTTPLSCFPVDDDRWAIVASNGGSERHPDWYYNLKANPVITVELGAETLRSWLRSCTAPHARRCGRRWSRTSPDSATCRQGSRDRCRYSS